MSRAMQNSTSLNSVVELDHTDPRWMQLISSHPEANIFHHPTWISLLADCYRYRPSLLALIGQEDEIVAGIPLMELRTLLGGHRLVSLPFSDYVPILATDPSAIGLLVDEARRVCRRKGASRFEFRTQLPLGEANEEGIYKAEPILRHETSLAGSADEIFSRLHRTRIQQPIRSAEGEGVRVVRASSLKDLRLFYDLHVHTRRRHGSPVQPLRFFELIYERLIRSDLGFLLLCYHGERVIGGSLFLHWNGIVTYKFNASNPVYWNRSPNHLALWHAIQWGVSRRYRLLDWGKTDQKHTGLRDFKRSWNSREEVYSYGIIADSPPDVGSSVTVRESIIRNAPLWVCRAAGEFLYRQFG